MLTLLRAQNALINCEITHELRSFGRLRVRNRDSDSTCATESFKLNEHTNNRLC